MVLKTPFVWFSRKTDWKCESCINYGCVANNSICDYCNGENHYEYDIQGFRERKESEVLDADSN